MKRFATVIVVVLACATASAPRAEEALLLFDYVGFDYESPNPSAATFGEIGSGYVSVGTVENLFAPLLFNEAVNRYTYVIDNLTSVARNVYGDFVVVDYSVGSLRVYEDDLSSGTAPLYGVNPPNATSPANFSDGTLYLEGTLTNFQIIINLTNNSGSFNSDFTATGGSQIGNIPVADRDGWQFSGLTGNATNIPLGYEHQVDGQVFLSKPTSTRSSTWGNVKSLYR
jgi:hypothetical protein